MMGWPPSLIEKKLEVPYFQGGAWVEGWDLCDGMGSNYSPAMGWEDWLVGARARHHLITVSARNIVGPAPLNGGKGFDVSEENEGNDHSNHNPWNP